MFWAARALHWHTQRALEAAGPTRDRPLGNRVRVLLEKYVVIGDRRLQLFVPNEECLVGAAHQATSIASLAFVHTARRCARLAVVQRICEAVTLRARACGLPAPSKKGAVGRTCPMYHS